MARHSTSFMGAVLLLGALLVAAGCAGAATSSPEGSLPPEGSPSVAPPPAGEACLPDQIRLVGQVRDKANPYYVAWLAGGAAFASSVGLQQTELTYNSDSQQQQSQVRTLLASGKGECTVLNVLPNNDTDTPVMVAAARDAGAYIVTQWNKPADLYPWDGYPTWITHLTYNDEDNGYQIAKVLFDSMGGQGNIVALQGVLGATAGSARDAGLDRALDEYPDIKLLDRQTADFDRNKATTVMNTLLTKWGDDIEGVWAANDDMAIGAVNALKAAGKAGTVKVVGIDAIPEAVAGVKEGTFAATALADAFWQGGIGLAFGYCTITGKLDPAGLTNDQRAWFARSAIVTEENVDQYIGDPDVARYVAEEWACDKLFNNFLAPLP